MFSQGMWLGLWILCFRLTSDKKNSIQLDQSWQLLNSVDRHLLVVADPWCSRGKRSQRLITSLTINHILDHVNLVRFNQAAREQMSQHKHRYINPVFNLTSKKNCMLREGFCQFNDELDWIIQSSGIRVFWNSSHKLDKKTSIEWALFCVGNLSNQNLYSRINFIDRRTGRRVTIFFQLCRLNRINMWFAPGDSPTHQITIWVDEWWASYGDPSLLPKPRFQNHQDADHGPNNHPSNDQERLQLAGFYRPNTNPMRRFELGAAGVKSGLDKDPPNQS